MLLASANNVNPEMFSDFSDRTKYDGLVPTGRYLMYVYKSYHETIQNYLDKEVKKRGGRRLHLDASYKEPKHLSQYKGNPIFKALITGTNEFGKIRIQFHAVTDNHEQLRAALDAFNKTVEKYGQHPTELVTTDKPGCDKNFLMATLPSLSRTQERLDLAPSTTNEMVNDISIPACTVSDSQIRVASTVTEINHCISAVRAVLRDKPYIQRVVSIDAEWDVIKNSHGMVQGSKKVALIRIGYCDREGNIQALLLQVHRHSKLPDRFISFLEAPGVTFVGIGVGGDLAKIGRDFGCAATIGLIENVINLGGFARKRDVIQNGTIGLAELVKVTLEELMNKAPEVRLSKWSRKELTDPQKTYAALDAIESLAVYFVLADKPDLTIRLSEREATVGVLVDVVPSHGNVAAMATRGASGVITCETQTLSPDGMLPSVLRRGAKTQVVRINSVSAPHMTVPYLKKLNRGKVCLGDFGEPPFLVVLPLTMLKPNVPSDSIRSYPESRDNIPDNTTPPAPIVGNTQCNDVGVDLTTDENSNANLNGNNFSRSNTQHHRCFKLVDCFNL
jgi:hypothetical protein